MSGLDKSILGILNNKKNIKERLIDETILFSLQIRICQTHAIHIFQEILSILPRDCRRNFKKTFMTDSQQYQLNIPRFFLYSDYDFSFVISAAEIRNSIDYGKTIKRSDKYLILLVIGHVALFIEGYLFD